MLIVTGFEDVDAFGQSAAVNLSGDGGINSLTGGSGADTIDGRGGQDFLFGSSGNDRITYDGNDFSINGGNATDTLVVNGAATIDLSQSDQSIGDAANVTAFENVDASGSGTAVSLTGDGGANVLTGGSGADTIVLSDGGDTLVGGLGADTFVIASFLDFTTGGTIDGTAEAGTIDTLRLDAGGGFLPFLTSISNIDAIAFNQNAANFQLILGSQTFTPDANGDGTQNDLLISAAVAMTNGVMIDASALTGTNHIVVDGTNLGGDDTITGGVGDDFITGGSGNDTIAGGNVFTGAPGADTLAGGAGFDRIYYDGSDLSIDGGLDFDTLVIFLTPATIDLALADQSLGDTAIVTGFEDVDAFGQSAAVNLSGDGGINSLTGGSGADTIDGRGGQDFLFGSSGNDRITYDGNDFSINGGNATDTLVVNGAATIDLSQSDQSIGDAANVTAFENVDASGSGTAVSLTGDGGANVLTGGSGNDTIAGGVGADIIAGGTNNDTLTGDAGNDSFLFNTTPNDITNVDQITDFIIADDTILLDNTVFTALTATGTLAAGNFAIGTAAAEADDFIIYDDASGALFYDGDGNASGGAQVQFATLNPGIALTHDDFFVA